MIAQDQFTTIDDATMEQVHEVMQTLPIAPVAQVDANHAVCRNAWGSAPRLDGDAASVLTRLKKNLESITARPGFQHCQARKMDTLPARTYGPQDAQEYLALMAFIAKPSLYAYPHHIWRTGDDAYVLWPSEVMGR